MILKSEDLAHLMYTYVKPPNFYTLFLLSASPLKKQILYVCPGKHRHLNRKQWEFEEFTDSPEQEVKVNLSMLTVVLETIKGGNLARL